MRKNDELLKKFPRWKVLIKERGEEWFKKNHIEVWREIKRLKLKL